MKKKNNSKPGNWLLHLFYIYPLCYTATDGKPYTLCYRYAVYQRKQKVIKLKRSPLRERHAHGASVGHVSLSVTCAHLQSRNPGIELGQSGFCGVCLCHIFGVSPWPVVRALSVSLTTLPAVWLWLHVSHATPQFQAMHKLPSTVVHKGFHIN